MAEETNARAQTPTKKAATKKTTTKKAPAKKAAAKKAAVRKAPSKKATKKAVKKGATAKKVSVKKSSDQPSLAASATSSRKQGKAKEATEGALHTVKSLGGAAGEAGARAYHKGAQGVEKTALKVKGAASQAMEKGKRFFKEHPAEAVSLGVAGLGVVAAMVGRKKMSETSASLANKAGKAASVAGESVKKAGKKLKGS